MEEQPAMINEQESLVTGAVRKLYQTPKLVEYGAVGKLTLTGQGSLTDMNNAMAMNTNVVNPQKTR